MKKQIKLIVQNLELNEIVEETLLFGADYLLIKIWKKNDSWPKGFAWRDHWKPVKIYGVSDDEI